MSLPRPTGRLVGGDLVLSRTFHGPIDDVWASITEPERTKRWFAEWRGDAGPGRTITYRLVFEGPDAAESEMLVEACEPPRRLVVSTTDEHGAWRLEARLAERGDGTTELELVHHGAPLDGLGEVGPGWEYYLDNLVASRDGSPLPDFDDYYPSQKAHYEGLAAP